jgi:hypothetical protein
MTDELPLRPGPIPLPTQGSRGCMFTFDYKSVQYIYLQEQTIFCHTVAKYVSNDEIQSARRANKRQSLETRYDCHLRLGSP